MNALAKENETPPFVRPRHANHVVGATIPPLLLLYRYRRDSSKVGMQEVDLDGAPAHDRARRDVHRRQDHARSVRRHGKDRHASPPPHDRPQRRQEDGIDPYRLRFSDRRRHRQGGSAYDAVGPDQRSGVSPLPRGWKGGGRPDGQFDERHRRERGDRRG